MSVLVIAEPGATHEGDLSRMLRLIDAAGAAGANVFKSQWLSSAERLCARRHAPEYLDDYRQIQYPLEWHARLRDHATARGLQYACSIYLPGDATRVAPYVDYLKISSFEAADGALREESIVAMAGRADQSRGRVLVSAGMGGDVAQLACDETRVLHCVSSYPAPLSALNLRAMVSDCDGMDCSGVSDHSHDVRVGAWAVCAGARVIEAHLRLDDTDPANRDYAVSFTPSEFTVYVANIRDAEQALGNGDRRVQVCERAMTRYRVRS